MHFIATEDLLTGVSFHAQALYNTSQPLFIYSVLATIVKNPSHAVFKLNSKHPAIEELLQEAGVGRERLELPIISMFRADFMATDRKTVDVACEENGVSSASIP